MRFIIALLYAYLAGCFGYIIAEFIISDFQTQLLLQIAKSSLLWGEQLVDSIKSKTFFSNIPLIVALICAVFSFGANYNRPRKNN